MNVNSPGTVLFFPAEIIELTNWLNMLKSHNKLSAIAFAKNKKVLILQLRPTR